MESEGISREIVQKFYPQEQLADLCNRRSKRSECIRIISRLRMLPEEEGMEEQPEEVEIEEVEEGVIIHEFMNMQ